MYRDIDHDTYQQIHDAALRHALALRQQAIHDFWRQARRRVARLLHTSRRPARLPLPREA